MKEILIFWVCSMLFCSLYTFILPTWGAFQARRGKYRKPVTRTATPAVRGANSVHGLTN
jgi:hypothetical protein